MRKTVAKMKVAVAFSVGLICLNPAFADEITSPPQTFALDVVESAEGLPRGFGEELNIDEHALEATGEGVKTVYTWVKVGGKFILKRVILNGVMRVASKITCGSWTVACVAQ